MPNRRVPDKLKLLKGTFQPCRAQKTMPDGLEPLPEPPRRLSPEIRKIWRDISRKAPHLRKPDQFYVELTAVLYHQFITDRGMQTARVSILTKMLHDLGLTPLGRKNFPAESQEPNPFDEF